MELKGKVAIVTGGNGGLGRRISFALAKNGVDVAIIFKESKQEAKSVSDQVRSFGVSSFPFQCDISKSEDVKSMLKAVESKFKVKVLGVTTMNFKGKRKNLTMRSSGNVIRTSGHRSSWKKAIVSLAKGEKIDFVEGEF